MPETNSPLHDFYKQRASSLIERIEDARDHLTDEHVRRIRVGIKRLRSLYRLMEFIRPKQFKSRRHERAFRKLFKRAGQLRDIQLSKASIDSIPLRGATAKRYARYLEKEEKKARKKLKKALKKFHKRDLKKAGKLIQRIGVTVSPVKVDQRLRTYIDREAAAIEVLQQAGQSTENTHQMRKHLKALIEVGTLLIQLAPDDALEQLLTKAKQTQQQVGLWHDRVVWLDHLEAFIAADTEQPDDNTERLIARQHQTANRQEKRVDQLMDNLTILLNGLAPWRVGTDSNA
ncbi:CHAD domain-containing protein [Fibrella sp. WM1]|uniref:CHAD domain-containing protein n=1 Tax=Fibrella musci TaxID=3242485 RepID=UPI0035221556